jgi:hypothetical protein
MPKVPRYDQPQVREAALPDVSRRSAAPIEAFGGGQANMAPAIGDFVARIDKIRDDADQVKALDAANKLKEAKTDLLFNPQTGAYTKKGSNAFGVVDEYGKNFDKISETIQKDLNENQKRYFKEAYGRERVDLNDSLSKHLFKEADEFEDQTVESSLSAHREDAILNYTDINKVRAGMLGQEEQIIKHAQRKGLPAQWVKLKLQDSESKTHAGIVKKYLADNNDVDAEKYFAANKDGFTAGDLEDVQTDLQEGVLRGKSQRSSDFLFDKYQSSMSQAVAEARKIEDPRLRDETINRLKDNYALKERADNERVENLHRSATDIIDQTGSVDKIPAGQWKQFSLSERSALKSYAKAKSEGAGVSTDWGKYYELKIEMPRDEFINTNLMKYRPILGDTEFKELSTLQAGLRKGDSKSSKTLDGYRTDSQIVNDALAAAGYNTSRSAGTKQKEKVNQFRKMVDDNIVQLQEQTKKKATNEDVQKIVDSLLLKGVTQAGIIFDTKKRRFELEAGENFQDIEIPDSEVKQIEEALKSKGKPVTRDNVIKLYLKGLDSGQ